MRRSPASASQVVIALVSCPTRRVARRLAHELIARRAAACVNIVPAIESTFRWQGKVDRARELLLIIKTTVGRFPALRRLVVQLHPYEVPEVIGWRLCAGHRPYLDWVTSSLSSG